MGELITDCVHWNACANAFEQLHGFEVCRFVPLVTYAKVLNCGEQCSMYMRRSCTNDSLKPDQFVCSVCNAHYDIARLDIDVDDDTGVPNYCPNCGAKVVK